jgi:hypothetical protein
MQRHAVFLLGLTAVAAAAEEDPVAVLMRLRDRVLESGERIPNHTCVETVQRDRFQPPTSRVAKSCDSLLARRRQADYADSMRIALTDRLRLDVLLAGGREIYSWAGAGKFEEGDIDELIPEGAMGTGPYASMLLSVFRPRDPRFFFDGETTVRGRPLLQYSFVVTQQNSGYRVKAGKEWVITGYTGTLLVDPESASLERFTVRTDELPPETHACETQTTLDYDMVRLGAHDYLLPKAARQRFVGRDGNEVENTLTFASCREYRAESTLGFGDASGPGGRSAGKGAAVMPVGLPVLVELAGVIHLDEAAAGDRIEGRLVEPVRGTGDQVVPRGAKVRGRLMRVETRYAQPPETTVALRWESVELDGEQAPLWLMPNRQAGKLKAGGIVGLRSRVQEIELPLPGEGRYGIFHFQGAHPLMEDGFRSQWLTAQPE